MNKKGEIVIWFFTTAIILMFFSFGLLIYSTINERYASEELCEDNNLEYTSEGCGWACSNRYCVTKSGELIKVLQVNGEPKMVGENER